MPMPKTVPASASACHVNISRGGGTGYGDPGRASGAAGQWLAIPAPMCPVGGAKSEKNASAGMHAKSKIGFLEKGFVYRKLANIVINIIIIRKEFALLTV
jgi:hypothetical protein